MPIRAVSFDCFQTLVHTDWDPVAFGVRTLLARGAQADPLEARALLQSMLVNTRPNYVRLHAEADRKACDRYWIDLFRRWASEYGQNWPEAELGEWLLDDLYGPASACFQVYEDVVPCLQELRAQGLRLLVVSNWDYSLERTLERRGLRGYFDCVLASLEIGVEKPDEGIFRAAESRLGLPPEEILHVGDHPVDDYEGAVRAGWHALLLDRGTPRPTEHSVVSSLLDVPQRVLEL
ncbi:MAG: HAD family hydrolase [Fimbriimonadaceae bacterium]